METLTQIWIDWGYWGLFLAAFVAGSIVPFSSEAVLVVLLELGLDRWGCLAAAAAGNTLGGMTCYWIGRAGRPEWIERLGIRPRDLDRARRFLAGRGALMGFFAFLPVIGEALAVVLGLLRGNAWLTAGSMLAGKALRYLVVLLSWQGITGLF